MQRDGTQSGIFSSVSKNNGQASEIILDEAGIFTFARHSSLNIMDWTSIDIGTLMGVTHWKGQARQETLLVKPRGAKGAYYYGDKVVRSKCSAILHIIARSELVVMERGMGARANVVNAQAKLRGYIEGLCDLNVVQTKEILPSEWRRPIKEHLGVSWPKKSNDQKALAQQVVKNLYNLDVSEDEADSICIGWSALRLGYINLNQ